MRLQVIEKVSKYIHEKMWSRWTRHFFDKNATILDKHRWTQQMKTRYRDLSEEDKEKDRIFARELVKIVLRESSKEIPIKRGE